MSKGFIKLNRGLLDHWVGDDPDVFLVWVRLLLKANFKNKKAYHKGQLRMYQRGSVYISTRDFARECGMGREKMRNVLNSLESDGMITHRTDHLGTTISVCNYDAYQLNQSEENPPTVPLKTQHHTTENPAPATTKKEKKEKNTPLLSPQGEAEKEFGFVDELDEVGKVDESEEVEVEEVKTKRFRPPTLDEVEAYFSERGHSKAEAARMFYFYESNGWMVGPNRMKVWKGAASGWMTRREQEGVMPRPSGSSPEDRYQWGEHEQDGFVWRVPLLDGNVLYNMSMWQKIREVGA